MAVRGRITLGSSLVATALLGGCARGPAPAAQREARPLALFGPATIALPVVPPLETTFALDAPPEAAPPPVARARAGPDGPDAPVPWALDLRPITMFDTHSQHSCKLRLYADDGSVDEGAAKEVDALLVDPAFGDRPLSRRLLQLLFRATWHFHADTVTVVSAWRASKRKGSRHAMGEAIDFAIAGVPSATVAAHLRTYAQVGVGIYTHPRTGFVHLDVRDTSFHWLDASPPGRSWREKGITNRGAPARDAAYRPEQDLPETATARPVVASAR